jgi:hypothetical protein
MHMQMKNLKIKKRKVISVLQNWQHCNDAPANDVFTFQ